MGTKKEETSSAEMARLASRVLSTGKATKEEALSLAGAVLTNAADKKPAAKPPAKKGR